MRCFFIFQYHFRKNIVSFFRSGHPVFVLIYKTAAPVLIAVARIAGPTIAVGVTLPYSVRKAMILTGINCREDIFRIRKSYISLLAAPTATARCFFFAALLPDPTVLPSLSALPVSPPSRVPGRSPADSWQSISSTVIPWNLRKQKVQHRLHSLLHRLQKSGLLCNPHHPHPECRNPAITTHRLLHSFED